jgi:hypothetical protein
MVAAKAMAIVTEEIVRGETVRFTVSYDVFGYDVLDKTGVVAQTINDAGKLLVYVEEIGEWCEPTLEMIERINPGHVSKKSKDFLATTRILRYSDG